MRTINITGNPNLKLLGDTFPDLRLNGDDLSIGQEVEIQSGNHFLGYAKIAAIRPVKLRDVSNEIAYMIIGQGESYLRAVLQKIYGHIDADRYLFLIILQWVKPVLEAQQQLFQRAWEHKKEKFTMIYRDLPENRSKQYALNF